MNKMKPLPAILLFVFLAGFFSTCKKYPGEEWWYFHLRKAEKRLTRIDWQRSQIKNYLNNKGVSGGTPNGQISFHKDGYFGGAGVPYLSFIGQWEFIENKDNLRITNDSSGTVSIFNIRTLEAKSFVMQNDSITYVFTIPSN